ncbi:hypothetical protein [Pontiella sp.]|uniref:hypothetical protein n=1 Tax=Pontiella sp. TaxID=2837462 RepID=UPI00356980E2
MKRILTVIAITATLLARAEPDLEQRVAQLEKEVAELKAALAPVIEEARAEHIADGQRNAARARMRKDAEIYSRDELKEIESLYQVANKQWKSAEGKESLKKLISKYDRANRTGCALLYLGQMSRGEERERYLQQAIRDFSDCYYGDGVQVGAYARYCLAYHFKESGEPEKAAALFNAIGEHYPDAINHQGKPLSTLIEQ